MAWTESELRSLGVNLSKASRDAQSEEGRKDRMAQRINLIVCSSLKAFASKRRFTSTPSRMVPN
jgi:hypothetical protein